MKPLNILIIVFSAFSFTACGQTIHQKETTKIIQKKQKMDTHKLTNETVNNAFEAWQNGDSKTFLSFFSSDAKLYDDGNPRNF